MHERYYFDPITFVFYPVSQGDNYDLDFSTMKQVDEETFQTIINGEGQRASDHEGNPILIPFAPSAFHHWDGKNWVMSAEQENQMLADFRQRLLDTISAQTDRLKGEILAGYPQAEIDSFYRQEREARAWQSDHNLPTPMLSAIADSRGVPLHILADKVIEKADKIAVIVGQIIGKRQAFEDRIRLAKTEAELTACEREIEQWQSI